MCFPEGYMLDVKIRRRIIELSVAADSAARQVGASPLDRLRVMAAPHGFQ
jgi:hypothetical protein